MRGRPKLDTTVKRNHRITIFLTDRELEQIEESWLDDPVRPKAEHFRLLLLRK